MSNINMSHSMMLYEVLRDEHIVQQMLDCDTADNYEVARVAHLVADKLGRNNVRPEFIARALRRMVA